MPSETVTAKDLLETFGRVSDILRNLGRIMNAWNKRPSAETADAVEATVRALDSGVGYFAMQVTAIAGTAMAEVDAWRARQAMYTGGIGVTGMIGATKDPDPEDVQ